MRIGKQWGYTYLWVLFLVAAAGFALVNYAEVWQRERWREQQADYAFIRQAYQAAFASYHRATPDGTSYRPQRLEHLLADPRYPNIRRHIRQLYPNPFTHQQDWIIQKDELGITGVCLPESRLQQPPLGLDGQSRCIQQP